MVMDGTATLMIRMFNDKELYKLWVLIPVSAKTVEKWGCCGRLKISKWLTLSRHFEYLISFHILITARL